MKTPDTTIKMSPRNDYVIIKVPSMVVHKADSRYWEMIAFSARKLAIQFCPATWGDK